MRLQPGLGIWTLQQGRTVDSTPPQSKSGSFSSIILAWLIAYVVSKAILAALGFRYALFSDPFDLAKLAIDLGVWTLVFALALVLLGWRGTWSLR